MQQPQHQPRRLSSHAASGLQVAASDSPLLPFTITGFVKKIVQQTPVSEALRRALALSNITIRVGLADVRTSRKRADLPHNLMSRWLISFG